jgi:hypothetical protein
VCGERACFDSIENDTGVSFQAKDEIMRVAKLLLGATLTPRGLLVGLIVGLVASFLVSRLIDREQTR